MARVPTDSEVVDAIVIQQEETGWPENWVVAIESAKNNNSPFDLHHIPGTQEFEKGWVQKTWGNPAGPGRVPTTQDVNEAVRISLDNDNVQAEYGQAIGDANNNETAVAKELLPTSSEYSLDTVLSEYGADTIDPSLLSITQCQIEPTNIVRGEQVSFEAVVQNDNTQTAWVEVEFSSPDGPPIAATGFVGASSQAPIESGVVVDDNFNNQSNELDYSAEISRSGAESPTGETTSFRRKEKTFR